MPLLVTASATPELANWSNLALYSAMAVYTIAMLLFAAHLAALGPDTEADAAASQTTGPTSAPTPWSALWPGLARPGGPVASARATVRRGRCGRHCPRPVALGSGQARPTRARAARCGPASSARPA